MFDTQIISHAFIGIILLFIFLLVLSSLLNTGTPINQTTKTCLITGASSGIGYEITREMIKRGWKVIGISHDEEKIKKVTQELGTSFIPYVCDVRMPEQIFAVSDAMRKQGLQPTLFFLNAGIGIFEEKFHPLLENHQQMVATNYFGTITWIDAWLETLKKCGGGTFVATSSVNSLFAGPGVAGYGASKAALNACFRTLRIQYLNDHIGFVLVLPGPVATNLMRDDKPLPFTHQASDEAHYIVKQVFKGKKQIEPSWIYSLVLRIAHWLPDTLVAKLTPQRYFRK
ncbi:MAG: SDR family oxidoreductase [Candidatus Babeliales bacterium]|jgi:short-subunit dehydrogenase